jgi:DNA polymerase/3'-5' exonuclease PolX
VSQFVRNMIRFPVDYFSEKYLKNLLGHGKTEVQDALQRLDMLTREEMGMAVAKNLEVTHEVDGNVKMIKELTRDMDGNVVGIKEVTQDINGNVKTIKELTQDMDSNVKATQDLTKDVGRHVMTVMEATQDVDDNVKAASELIRDVDGNVKVIEQVTRGVDDNVNRIVEGAQTSLIFMHLSTKVFVTKQSRTNSNVSYSLTLPPSIAEAETYSQRTSHVRNFEHGSLLQILR